MATKAQKIEMLFLAVDKASSTITQITKKMKVLQDTTFTTARKFDTITGAINSSMAKRGGWVSEVQKIPWTLGKSVKVVTKLERNFERLYAQAKKFDMRMLSIMFAGMALKRAFGGALRSIHNSFKKAEDNTSELSRSTMGLNASWEFLKFSIFNALDQPVFLKMIEFLIKGVNWISKMINKYPELGIAIMAVFGAFAVGGTIMMIIGQFSLGWQALFGVGGVLAKSTAAGVAESQLAIGTGMSAISKMLKGAFLFYLIYDGFKKFKDGDVAGIFGALAAGAITWTAGLGYGVAFYLAFKGIEWSSGKLMQASNEFRAVTDVFPDTSMLLRGWESLKAGFTGGDATQAIMDASDAASSLNNGFTSFHTIAAENNTTMQKLKEEAVLPLKDETALLGDAINEVNVEDLAGIEQAPSVIEQDNAKADAAFNLAEMRRQAAAAAREQAQAERELREAMSSNYGSASDGVGS